MARKAKARKTREYTRKRQITTITQNNGEKGHKQHFQNEWASLPEFSSGFQVLIPKYDMSM